MPCSPSVEVCKIHIFLRQRSIHSSHMDQKTIYQSSKNKNLSLLFIIVMVFASMLFPLTDPTRGVSPNLAQNEELEIPSYFDLRDVNSNNYVTTVKSQIGGTCWAHAATASIESNLLMTDTWEIAREIGEPNLSECHLNWWNGFNTVSNDDDPQSSGITVGQGGNYLITAAYLSRGEGAVKDTENQTSVTSPKRQDDTYHYYYPWDIEWYTAGKNLTDINTIKYHIMTQGALGTCLHSHSQFMQNNIHYQPPESTLEPNHAVAIIGWDDNKITQAPQPGAWLCKNSWGDKWGESGFFWISYYDKHCCQHPELGAVSFQNVKPMHYDPIYYHDYHGWCATLMGITEAFNAFTSTTKGLLKEVNFYTTMNNATYTVKIFDTFQNNSLQHEKASATGTIPYIGMHTVTLNTSVPLIPGDDFYVYLNLSTNEHPIDITSDVTVLLGSSPSLVTVKSASNPGESYYYDGVIWQDLYTWNNTANFCMKALVSPPFRISYPNGLPMIAEPGTEITLTVKLEEIGDTYIPESGYVHYRYDNGTYETLPLNHVIDDLYNVILPPLSDDDNPEYYFSLNGSLMGSIYDPPTAPGKMYSVRVESQPQIIKGDFDNDGDIDVFDLDGFAQSWGSTKNPGGNYNECFDFNDDGNIDVFDLDGFAQVWGKTYS